ncbi:MULTISPECIES: hypothetical protein [unclassified Achromobacter]|uniref:hypothetical protein n=1 Tax=unclassified Achromobacter TaxID=2626865 RepID=UPI000B51C332|nr:MULTISPECIES: hypothetical protein [unclassified Achromobacter]OWT72728.1 hypothetical protein CEY05_22730 [Achromobacter sp. HZ34]OWT73947.1 hypothetical protein CEY04_21555 [Achromobacter sp. HZ28]
MRTFYWVSGIGGTWTYIDAAYKQHGRIDWFDNIADIGYWWQTAYDNGMSYSLDVAKRSVEQSILRRATETAARVMEQTLLEDSITADDEGAAEATGKYEASNYEARNYEANANLHAGGVDAYHSARVG